MTPDKDILWKQYSLNVELYKFYMDLVVKINLVYYGITGAILSFYFTHPEMPFTKLALGLPIVMSFVLAGIFFYGAKLMPILRNDIFALRDQLGLSTAPDLGILTIVLRAFGSLLLIVALVLVLFIIFEKKLNPLPELTSGIVPTAGAIVIPPAVVHH